MDSLHKSLNEIPIITKTYEFYKLFYGYLLLFPQRDKYTLGSKCETYIIAILELLLEAGAAVKTEKLTILRRTSVKLDALKIFIRVAKDLKCIDNKKYLLLQTHLQQIGQQLGGWYRSLSSN